jgi:hypothetical protein
VKRLALLLSCMVLLAMPAFVHPAANDHAAAARSVFGSNLIVNGGAENSAGAPNDSAVLAPVGWKASHGFTVVQYGASGGFPDLASPGPKTRGKNFFAGGPDIALSTATQHIDVSAGAASFARATYTASGYFGGYGSQGDFATLSVKFLNAAGTSVGSASIGGVTPQQRNDVTGLLKRSTAGHVPVGTRSIDVVLTMTRKDGSYDDGSADNLSLVLLNGKKHERGGTSTGH